MSKKYIYITCDYDDPPPEIGISYDPPLQSDLDKINYGMVRVIEIDDDFADGESEVKIIDAADERADLDAVVVDQFADLDPFHVVTKHPETYES